MAALAREIETAIALCREGGRIALEIGKRDFSVEEKGHGEGPVTEADRAVSEHVMRGLQAAFPDDAVVSEEAPPPARAPKSGRFWFLDPIDGTKEFVRRNGEWSVLLGLVEGGEPVLGVTYIPEHDVLYRAVRGQGAWRVEGGSETPIECRAREPGDSIVLVRSRSHHNPKVDAIAARLPRVEFFTHGSVGIKLARIAEGRADLYFNLAGRCHYWDVCAGDVLLREAGGSIVGLDEAPVEYPRGALGPDSASTRVGRPFMAVSDAAHDEVAQVVRAISTL